MTHTNREGNQQTPHNSYKSDPTCHILKIACMQFVFLTSADFSKIASEFRIKISNMISKYLV